MAKTFISRHFSLTELTTTNTGLSNTPHSPVVLDHLRQLCLHVLEPVREHYGKSVIIHSGYRSPEVNKAVGGSISSQHVRGQAADFHVAGFTVHELALWISQNLDRDQLILENFVPGNKTSGWVHCSFAKDNRQQDLTKFKGSRQYHVGILLNPQDSLSSVD